jgi:hypothetical protein
LVDVIWGKEKKGAEKKRVNVKVKGRKRKEAGEFKKG